MLLSNTDGEWHLDGVIDWESVCISDPRVISNEEPWRTIRAFGLVIKGSHLADCVANFNIPRCELMELVENSEKAG